MPGEMLFVGLALQGFENLSANEIFGRIGQAGDMRRETMGSSRDGGERKRLSLVS
jgi:hypothetical protein